MSGRTRVTLPDGRQHGASTFEPEGQFSSSPPANDRPVFKLLVRAEPGVDETRALRSFLKTMLRGFGLRCLSITREK